jgi:hypothetical protein
MIGVQVSEDNCLGRFTKIAERLKKKVDATKPESIKSFVDVVLNAPKETREPRTADEIKEALHQTFMRYLRSILRKEKKTMDVVTARNVMLEEVGYLLHAFELKGEYKLTASAPPNDEYQTWALFTKKAPASGSVMEETEHFGEFFGRLNPKNPFADSTPWELVSDADPKKLKPTGGYARNKPDAAMAAKKLFEQSEAAKTARAAKKPKADDKAEGAAAGA